MFRSASFLAVSLLAAGSAATAAPAATSADRAFVAKVSQGGMFEVAAGRLAERRGGAQDVRDFGTMEVHDHMLVGDRLKAISTAEGVPVPAQLNGEFSAKMTRLGGLSGAAFDRAYMAEMATLHDGDGAAFASEAQGGSAPYRGFAGETHRIVQRHIGAIRALPAG